MTPTERIRATRTTDDLRALWSGWNRTDPDLVRDPAVQAAKDARKLELAGEAVLAEVRRFLAWSQNIRLPSAGVTL